jgi:transposase-like protein
MNPQDVFCPNWACPARGQTGQGNIGLHDGAAGRYTCHVCHTPFSDRTGTPFYRRRTPEDTITHVVTLVAHGCPVPAITAAFGFQARTVRAWVAAAGRHAQAVHAELVQQPRDLGHVQADEIRVRAQGQVLWLALVLQVCTRLWLGGAVSPTRDRAMIETVAGQVRACAARAWLLIAVDGLPSYVGAFQRAFRERVLSAGVGAPRKVIWDELVIGRVMKEYAAGRVVRVGHWIAQGTASAAAALGQATGSRVLNTAYIERLNGTFRSRLAGLARRTRHWLHTERSLTAGMYLVGTVYNFCTPHASLGTREAGGRTPAMGAGITDHCWTVGELLRHHVPPPRWVPPKQRGRPSAARKRLVERWAA